MLFPWDYPNYILYIGGSAGYFLAVNKTQEECVSFYNERLCGKSRMSVPNIVVVIDEATFGLLADQYEAKGLLLT